ncbi:MAG: carbamoyltransferase C-terminal domain-containing protein [Alphaproteobacteria bacterium]|nr:carbamoyltransferase C-terminal domain-containing protein [Alphaproteobacteria bacterium]
MIILGLSCGHDASASILKNGKIVAHVLRERVMRKRHTYGLGRETIEQVLKAANLSISGIDACAVAGTKDLALQVHDAEYCRISFSDNTQAPFADLFPNEPLRITGYQAQINKHLHNMADYRLRLHAPVTVHLDGRAVPGFLVDHHAAHAASSYFASNFDEALVLSHDSSAGRHSGLFFYGKGSELFPLMPHGLEAGVFYNHVAARCGLKGAAGAGKLMGLSAYGKPVLCPPDAAGTVYDWLDVCAKAHDGSMSIDYVHEIMLDLLLREAERRGYDLSVLGDAARLPSPVAADLAASAQKMFSDSLFAAVAAAKDGLAVAGLFPRHLCLGGGASLNCPANTRLALESGFENLFIPPHCDNGGLSLGAAWWLAHNVSGEPRVRQASETSRYAMMGPDRGEEIHAAIAENSSWLQANEVSDPATQAANDLAKNLIVGWFEGGSETGPRALGHRSILADPREADNWKRVNAIKDRESWRPFAPMCLLQEMEKWFEQGPRASPFMLFTYRVKSDKQPLVPAVCHVDGTARVQTVTPEDGNAFSLLTRFAELTGVPLVLNTSFNGPGEPIVESPREALAFFRNSALDVLYLGSWRITRK